MSQTKAQLIDPTDGSIVNADINASAAIAVSKLSGVMPSAGGTFSGDVSFGDNNITNVGVIALDTIKGDADDNTNISFGGSDTISLKCGTTNPALTINTTQVKVEDGHQFVAGTGNDLQILHSGGVNQILSGGANLKIGTSGETFALFENNASVQLYYDNEKMFTTNGDGAEFFDSDSNLNIYFTTNNTTRRGYIFVESTNGGKISFYDSQNHPMLSCTKDGPVELFHDNVKTVETSTTHTIFTGNTSGNHAGIKVRNTNTGSHSRAEIRLEAENAASFATIFCDHVNTNLRLGYNSTGTTVAIDGNADMVTGTIIPNTDNSKNLGSASFRWANIFTTDLKLSNEGSQNDVDSTWGNYTIQEGHEDLFLINHRTGKKFKFNLTEVA